MINLIVMIGLLLMLSLGFVIGVRSATKIERDKFEVLSEKQGSLLIYIIKNLESDETIKFDSQFNHAVKIRMEEIHKLRSKLYD